MSIGRPKITSAHATSSATQRIAVTRRFGPFGSATPRCRALRDHVEVEVAGQAQELAQHRTPPHLLESGSSAGTDHELGRSFEPGDGDERLRHVVTGHLEERTAELVDQAAARLEIGGSRAGSTGGGDPYPDEVTVDAVGHSSRPADHPVVTGGAGHRHQHPFARPGAVGRPDDALLRPSPPPPGRPPRGAPAAAARPGPPAWNEFERAASTPSLGKTLPCAIRRRSASGVMSTSSIWSARRTHASGTVSSSTMPVVSSTTSWSDSSCWMLSVEMTSRPAATSTSMSSQRWGRADPGGFDDWPDRRPARPPVGGPAATPTSSEPVPIGGQGPPRVRRAVPRCRVGAVCRPSRSPRGRPGPVDAVPRRAWRRSRRRPVTLRGTRATSHDRSARRHSGAQAHQQPPCRPRRSTGGTEVPWRDLDAASHAPSVSTGAIRR